MWVIGKDADYCDVMQKNLRCVHERKQQILGYIKMMVTMKLKPFLFHSLTHDTPEQLVISKWHV